MLKRPTIVIFDMDGTTVRHLDPKMLGLMEWVDDTVFKITRIWSWLFERRAYGPILTPGDLADPEREVRKAKSLIVHKAIHKLRSKPIDLLVEPCPGIYALLRFLRAHGVPMALVSNGLGKGYGEDIVRQFGFDEFFPIAIFREDIFKSKPDPEALLLALGKLERELTPDDVIWYIGDRHKDIKAVKAAQKHLPCRIEPVACGLNAAVAAIELGYGPDHILLSHRDTYAVLKKLLGTAPALQDAAEKNADKTEDHSRRNGSNTA